MNLMEEDSDGYLCASRTKLRQDVRSNIVVTDDMMELEAIVLVLELADFQAIGIHVLFVAIPRLFDLVDDHCRVAVDQ
jgi:hypothetical protein